MPWATLRLTCMGYPMAGLDVKGTAGKQVTLVLWYHISCPGSHEIGLPERSWHADSGGTSVMSDLSQGLNRGWRQAYVWIWTFMVWLQCCVWSSAPEDVMWCQASILDLAGSRAAHPFCSLHGKPQAAPGVAGLLRSLPHKPTDLASSCSLFSLIRASLQTAWCWAGERRDIAGTREIALFTLLTTVPGPWSLLVGCSVSNNFHSRNAVNAAQRVVERCLHLYL